MNTAEIIDEASSLPVEERALIVDSLLQSLNLATPEIDEKWIVEGNKRLDEMRSGKITATPGNEVFEKIWKKFDK